MVKQNLFPKGIHESYTVNRMEGELSDLEEASKNYEQVLPESLEIILLSLCLLGHIASLLPQSPSLLETHRTVIPIVGPKTPTERLTITHIVIQSAKSIFVFVKGKEKGLVLAQALENPDDVVSLPLCLALGAISILETKAYEHMNKKIKF